MGKNSWDIPSFPKKGDDTNTKTFAAVGNALSQWEWLEGNLALLYSALVGSGQDEGFAAMRSYGSIVSFQSRCKMLEAASEIYFAILPDSILQEALDEHLKNAERLSARRNEIAHGIVQLYVADVEEAKLMSSYALVPAYYATRKRRFAAKDLGLQLTTATYIYSSVEINNFAGAFASLVDPTIELTTRILASKRGRK